MIKWEYRIAYEDSMKDILDQTDRINLHYGAHGWELVSVIADGNKHIKLYFKRPLEPK